MPGDGRAEKEWHMKTTFFKTIYEMAGQDDRIVFIKGDTAYVPDFQNSYPAQYLDVGIAEQNMIGVAAGMALEGKIPITYSIVNFATMRCLEQIRNDVAYHRLNVKVVSCGQGFDYGPLGATHHALEDIAIMRAMPNMTVFCPCDPVEAAAVIKAALQMDGPCFIRNGHGGEPVLHQNGLTDFQIGKALPLIGGTDIVLCVCGSIAKDAYGAAQKLRGMGLDAGLYSFPTVKPLDTKFILERLDSARLIVSIEEHTVIGGFGSALAEVIAQAGPHKALFRQIGLKDTFSDEIGSREHLKQYYGMDETSIVNEVLTTIRGEENL